MTVIELSGVARRFGPTHAVRDLELAVRRGELLALLGPSGSGKTTALRLIAGFERPDAGRIVVNGQVVADAATGAWAPPERRGVGMVFQDLALFPHLTVAENVAFGLRDTLAGARRSRTDDVLSLVGVAELAGRYPHELSGGQQQRVALARALAPGAGIVLLDEPFASLDADLRDQLREELARIVRQTGTTAVIVTHDQAEALALADRVGVLHDGRLEQIDPPDRVYHYPATRFVADFVGHADFLPVRCAGDRLDSEVGAFENPGIEAGPDLEVMVRPDDIRIAPDPRGEAVVLARRFRGGDQYCTLALASGGQLHCVRPSSDPLPLGSRVRVVLRPVSYVLFADGRPVGRGSPAMESFVARLGTFAPAAAT